MAAMVLVFYGALIVWAALLAVAHRTSRYRWFHPSWGVAFHDRFANGPALRNAVLFGHIGLNSLAFVLAYVQMAKPGNGGTVQATRHRIIGRLSFAAISLGTLFAVWLASEHTAVEEYGGVWSMLGFCIWLSAPLGILLAESFRRRRPSTSSTTSTKLAPAI